MVLITGTAALGMGSGAVFQLVPLRFRRHVGVVTGMVGAAGGLYCFYLLVCTEFVRYSSSENTLAYHLGAGEVTQARV